MPKPIHALVGPDPFLQRQELLKVLAQLPADTQRTDVDGETVQLAPVLDELRTFGMFAATRVVVVRNADDFVTRFRESLETYAASPSDSAVLVLRLSSLPATQRLHKAIAKTGVVVKCEPPKLAEVPGWVIAHGKSAHGLAVAADAANLLAELLGTDLGRIDTELAKLAIMAEGGKVTAREVSASVPFQREQEIKEMTGQIAIGDVAGAVKRWRQILTADATAEFRAVTWLGMWLEDVAATVAARRVPQALSWKYPGPRLARFGQTAMALGQAGHRRAVALLTDTDLRSKSGRGNAADNVEWFLLAVHGKS